MNVNNKDSIKRISTAVVFILSPYLWVLFIPIALFPTQLSQIVLGELLNCQDAYCLFTMIFILFIPVSVILCFITCAIILNKLNNSLNHKQRKKLILFFLAYSIITVSFQFLYYIKTQGYPDILRKEELKTLVKTRGVTKNSINDNYLLEYK